MKKILVLALVAVVLLAGCEPIVSLFRPIVGTWETTILGVSVRTTFSQDDTYTDTESLVGSWGLTQEGTWDSTENSITKTSSGGSETEYSYSFNSGKSELMLTQGGISVTYTRQ